MWLFLKLKLKKKKEKKEKKKLLGTERPGQVNCLKSFFNLRNQWLKILIMQFNFILFLIFEKTFFNNVVQVDLIISS